MRRLDDGSEACTCLSISRDPLCVHHGDVDKVAAIQTAERYVKLQFTAREAVLSALAGRWREAARLSLPMIESDADEGYRAALLDCASQIERLVLAAREGEGEAG